MATQIHVYKGNPTSGGTDGTLVSEGQEFTVTSASPGVFTAVAHGLTTNDVVYLKTTGALYTGLAINTPYYVISTGLTADVFRLSATQGGSAINTSGSQSGTHSVSKRSSVITTANLRADQNEVGADIKLAVRCVTSFKTISSGGHHAVLSLAGANAAKWALAPDSSGSAGTYGAYGADLNIDTEVGATNKLFWIKAKATSDESPQNDITVTLVITAVIGAV